MRKPETTVEKQANPGQFKRGQSGNPDGRPVGARNKVTLAIEALLEGEAAGLTRKAIELAMAGDTTALRLCLERLAPPVKERSVAFDLPEIKAGADVPAALDALLRAVAAGQLTPSEASTMAGVIEKWRGAYEIADLDQRLTRLEAAANKDLRQ